MNTGLLNLAFNEHGLIFSRTCSRTLRKCLSSNLEHESEKLLHWFFSAAGLANMYQGIEMNMVMWFNGRFMCAFPQSALPAASWCWPHLVLTSLPPDSKMMVWPFHLSQHCNVTHSVNWKLISSLNASNLSPLSRPPPLASDSIRALNKEGQKSKFLDGTDLQYSLPALWVWKRRTQPAPYFISVKMYFVVKRRLYFYGTVCR